MSQVDFKICSLHGHDSNEFLIDILIFSTKETLKISLKRRQKFKDSESQ